MRRAGAAILPALAVLLAVRVELAAQQAQTTQAFDCYVVRAEVRIGLERNSTFLKLNSLSATQRTELVGRLRRGEVMIEKQGNTPRIPDGLIHDWIGTVFVPGASVPQVIALVRDYNHVSARYSPDVMQARLVSAKGDDLHVFMRLKKHKIVTVVLDTEYAVHYGRIDDAHQYSVSRSTRVSEIAEPETRNEHALVAGHDHGFMWRLNSYWAFEQAEDGVLVQCEAISLTRDIPAGLTWMIGSFVNSIPRESLQFTLNATRAAMTGTTLVSRKQN